MLGRAVYSLVIITVAVLIAMVLMPDNPTNETGASSKPDTVPAASPKRQTSSKKKSRGSHSAARRTEDVVTATTTAPAGTTPELNTPIATWDSLFGIAADEGNSIGAVFKDCDLTCCRRKCEGHRQCNSISHRADRSLCYLKDQCLSATSPVSAAKSRYVSHFIPCAQAEVIDEDTLEFLDSTDYVRGEIDWAAHPAAQHITSGQDRCLFPRCGSGGTGLGTWVHPQVFQPFNCWRPLYSSADAGACLAGKRVALLGDSLSRFMYWCLAYSITGEPEYETMCRNYRKSQEDMGPIVLPTITSNSANPVTLEFLWVPSISGSDYQGNPLSRAALMQKKLEDIILSEKYDTVIANFGLWDMLHTEIASPRTFAGLTQLMDKLDQKAVSGSKLPDIVWMSVQSVVEDRTNPRRSNDLIMDWNHNVSEVLLQPGRRSGRQFFQWLDAFEMTITAAPERTLRDDGRHFVSNIVLQIVNAALNLLCPLPSDLANTKQPSFAHTTCTERVLPEVYNERITRGLIQNYMQSKWVLENDTRSEEEKKAELYGLGYERLQPLFSRQGVPTIIKGGPGILDLSQAFSTPQQRMNWIRDTAPMQTVGVRGYPKNESQVRLSHYIDNIMPTSPKTNMQFSGNVGNSKVSARAFRALGLKFPRWFQEDEFEKPESSTQASIWLSHAGGTTPMHRDHIHEGNIAQPVVGAKTWYLVPPWIAPWACVTHNNINKVGFSKVRHPMAESHWKEMCPDFANVVDQTIVLHRFEPPDGLFIPGGWFHAVDHVEQSAMFNFWIQHDAYEPIGWKSAK